MPARKGGTYRIDDKGQRQLVKRTEPAVTADPVPQPPAETAAAAEATKPAKPAKGGN